MIKTIINVPKGIRYISEWPNFNVPNEVCILNKTLTGCGFTEWILTSPENTILCSPRKVLLENKQDQHPEVFYFRNELDFDTRVDKDITKDCLKEDLPPEIPEGAQDRLEQMKQNFLVYCYSRLRNKQPVKAIVTYDSFRLVKEILQSILDLSSFGIYVDEFQSIFTDSRFKSSTEIEFLSYLQDLPKICFVSATPMMDKYLEMLDEYKNLPYYELDWAAEDSSRVVKPNLEIKALSGSITAQAKIIIDKYLSGNYDKASYRDQNGIIHEIQSKEAVIYVNSVKNICDIIRKCGLGIENTNVLCARTPENEKAVKKAFGLKGKGVSGIGKVPLRGEPRKMFTLCTRTVYLGADFYSDNAQSFVFSDANIDCLSVDITTDLPQILGRQRLSENPWKNSAKLYYKLLAEKKVITMDDFNQFVQKKVENTNKLLSAYSKVDGEEKKLIVEKFLDSLVVKNYRKDYVAVNRHAGNTMVPVFNNLVLVSEMRTFEIQQIDYKDRFSVFNTLVDNDLVVMEEKIDALVREFNSFTTFPEKMKYLCNLNLPDEEMERFINSIPLIFKNYYLVLGVERIKSYSYRKSYLDAEYEKQFAQQSKTPDIIDLIYNEFIVGCRYSKAIIKDMLRNIYEQINYPSTPKASDIEKWFEIRDIVIVDKVSGKRDHGFEIIKKKDI